LNASIRKVVMTDLVKTISSYENADILQRPIHCINLYDAISGNDIVEPIVVDNTSHFVAPQANILIVDDNPANLKIATGMMERYKMNIQTALSGTACLEMLMESMEYDMVFLDYSMTGISGVETLRTLREYNDKYYKTLPVIAMPVHMVNGAKELFVKEGFDDYIPKPFEPMKLNMILETYLPEEIPEMYRSNFETIGKADLTRSGDNANVFAPGIPTVMEFTGTEDGLQLAGELVKAHGRLGIGGYHNDGPRTIDYKLWNFKAITTINCHERRIEYEAGLCRRCMELLEKGIWKFTGVTRIYDMKDFDKVSEMMEHHTDNFIKAGIRP